MWDMFLNLYFFFFKSVFAILGPLNFHMSFRICFSSSKYLFLKLFGAWIRNEFFNMCM